VSPVVNVDSPSPSKTLPLGKDATEPQPNLTQKEVPPPKEVPPQVVAPSPNDPEIPEVLKKVETRYQTGKTLRAQFEQKEFIQSTGRIKSSQGTIEVKRPNKIRWETRSPDANLLVSDGRTFWFYTPPFEEGERGQVVEKKAHQVQSKLAQTLISGSFSLTRDLKIETIDPTHYRLVPKKGSAGTVKAAEIRVDIQKHEISEVKLEHRGGNRTEIKLSQITLGEKLPDELFHFIVPPQTDRMPDESQSP
jgi:chaperone LolA